MSAGVLMMLKSLGLGPVLEMANELAQNGTLEKILAFGDKVAGYANYGRNRARTLHFDGEIYELYLRPEYQGLGFGRRLFSAARKDLMQSGLKSLVVWALSDNEPAVEFYRALGGRLVELGVDEQRSRSECVVIDPGQKSIAGVTELVREHRLKPIAVELVDSTMIGLAA